MSANLCILILPFFHFAFIIVGPGGTGVRIASLKMIKHSFLVLTPDIENFAKPLFQ